MRQSRRQRLNFAAPLIYNAFAVRERLGIPRDLPYFRLPYFQCMPPTLPRWSTVPSRCTRTAIPGFLEFVASRYPQPPSLPAIPDGSFDFGAASFSLCYGLHFCLALRTGYDWMKPLHFTLPSEVHCHPRFSRRPSPDRVGNQARWANGKSPIVGTLTQQVAAASEAAHKWQMRNSVGYSLNPTRLVLL